jgi:hypothetical protein
MARYVVVTPVTIAGSGYAQPARPLLKGQVVELSAAEVTAAGAGNLRAVSTTTLHDALGEASGVSNSST